MVTGSPSKKPDSPPAPTGETTQWWKPGDSVPLAVGDIDTPLPNWFEGPITLWGIVDRHGTVYVFGSERARFDLLERWEKTLKQFAPYRAIELVERPRERV